MAERFGQKQDPKSQYAAVIPRFIVANLQGEAPVLYGDGQQSRDFVHVDNVVRANLAACTASSRCAGSVLNIGSGEPTKLVDLAQAIRSIAGGDLQTLALANSYGVVAWTPYFRANSDIGASSRNAAKATFALKLAG